MAKANKKNSLKDRIEAESARDEIRYEKPKAPGGGSLPAGVDGVAKLTRVDFDEIENGDYKGEQRFYCHGTCVSPKEHDGIPIEGRLVQPGQITLADTTRNGETTTFKENYVRAENRMKLLGFPTEDFDDVESEALAYFEANSDSMYFSFRTWKPDDGDRVVVLINGPVKDYTPDDSDDIQEEEAPAPKVAKAAKAPAKAKAKPVEEEPEEDDEEEEEVNLSVIAKKANKGDKEAQMVIARAAKELDIDPEDDEFEDWTSVVVAIEAAKKKPVTKGKAKAVEPEEDEEPETVEPKKGQVFGYKPPKSRKIVECEVTKVLKKTQTVDLKSLADDTEYDAIDWDDLVEVSN